MTTPIQINDVLWNAQEKHRNHPDTFYAPSLDALTLIKAGDHVKIGLEFGPGDSEGVTTERFWIEVTAADETSVTGTVANHLIYTEFHNLSFGDLVQFDVSAVMNILEQEL